MASKTWQEMTEEEREVRRAGGRKGSARRWAGHVKKEKVPVVKDASYYERVRRTRILVALRNGTLHIRPVVCEETGEIFGSVRQAAKAYDVSQTAIYLVCKEDSPNRRCAGMHWHYATPEEIEAKYGTNG